MRSKKDTILIYLEIREMIEKLTREQAGTIFMAILDYCDSGVIPELDPFLEMVFIPIRQSLDRSKKQYESRCEKNRAAARKRWGKTEKDDVPSITPEKTEKNPSADANGCYPEPDPEPEPVPEPEPEPEHHPHPEPKAPPQKKSAKTGKKLPCGTFQNVFLSEEDQSRLKKEFPKDWQAYIDDLSCFIASTGRKYENHLATILSWARKENRQDKRFAQREQKKQEILHPPSIMVTAGRRKDPDPEYFSDDIYEIG